LHFISSFLVYRNRKVQVFLVVYFCIISCVIIKKIISFFFEQLDYTEPTYLMGSLVTYSASMWVPYTALLLFATHVYLFLCPLFNVSKEELQL
jgi:hypothetical protein